MPTFRFHFRSINMAVTRFIFWVHCSWQRFIITSNALSERNIRLIIFERCKINKLWNESYQYVNVFRIFIYKKVTYNTNIIFKIINYDIEKMKISQFQIIFYVIVDYFKNNLRIICYFLINENSKHIYLLIWLIS